MTISEVEALATYNAERARGIQHTDIWNSYMAKLQENFDREVKLNPPPWHPKPRWWQMKKERKVSV